MPLGKMKEFQLYAIGNLKVWKQQKRSNLRRNYQEPFRLRQNSWFCKKQATLPLLHSPQLDLAVVAAADDCLTVG